MHVALRTLGYRRTARWIRLRRPPLAPVDAARVAADGVAALRRARRYGVFRGNCLSQSAALQWWMHRAGAQNQIRFGARQRLGQFEAHAWVEHEGVALNEGDFGAEPYAPLRGAGDARDLESRLR